MLPGKAETGELLLKANGVACVTFSGSRGGKILYSNCSHCFIVELGEHVERFCRSHLDLPKPEGSWLYNDC